jgi:hypothetical protein
MRMALAAPPTPRTGSPAVPPVRVAQLLREYVPGGGYAAYRALVQALPPAPDALGGTQADATYERMLQDAQVAACLAIFKAAILEDGVQLTPAVESTDPDHALAVTIRDEAAAMLDALQLPLDDVLWDLLDAMAFGHRVAEQVYAYAPGRGGQRLLQLTALKPKPRQAVHLVVDAYLNVVGLAAAAPGQLTAPTGGGLRPQDLLPRAKFALLIFRPQHSDPRGTSLLRPAYLAWWRKQQIIPEYLKYLHQLATPSVIGFTPEGAQDEPQRDAEGRVIEGAWITPEEAMTQALAALMNGTVLGLPYGSKVQPLEMQGNGEAFLKAFAESNREITKALLTQQLATEEGVYQARAAAEVHEDILETLVRQGKKSVQRMLARDVLRPWVGYNWGAAAARLTPIPSLGATEQRTLPALMNAVANLQRAGYFHPSQLAAIDTQLGLPVRDPTSAAAAPADAAEPAEEAAA